MSRSRRFDVLKTGIDTAVEVDSAVVQDFVTCDGYDIKQRTIKTAAKSILEEGSNCQLHSRRA